MRKHNRNLKTEIYLKNNFKFGSTYILFALIFVFPMHYPKGYKRKVINIFILLAFSQHYHWCCLIGFINLL